MMQWVEEADREDPIIPLKKDIKRSTAIHCPMDALRVFETRFDFDQ